MIFTNVKIWGQINVDAGKRSSWQLAISQTRNRGFTRMVADKDKEI
jgi:hypothetical protein